jgi:two-component system sensor histidine kinase YesM
MKLVKKIKFQAICILLCLTMIPVVLLSLFANLRLNALYDEKMDYQVNRSIENLSLYIKADIQKLIDRVEFFASNQAIIAALERTDADAAEKYKSIYGEFYSKDDLENKTFINYIVYDNDNVVYTQFTYSPNGGNYDIYRKAARDKWFLRLKNTNSNAVEIFTGENLLNSLGGEQLYVARNFVDKGQRAGILQMGMSIDDISEKLNNAKISASANVYLIDENGSLVASGTDNTTAFADISPDISADQTDEEIRIGGETYVVISAPIALKDVKVEWKIVTIAPTSELYQEMNSLNVFTVILVLICVVLIVLMIYLISRMILDQILKINNAMTELSNGNLSVSVSALPDNEIGELGRGFNDVVLNINRYIDEIKGREEQKRALEIEMLQSQIKPHFIKNTITTIRWMADIQGQNSISKIALSLSKLLDYNLKDTEVLTTVVSEIEYLKEYLYLQQLYYKNKFDYEINVSEQVMQYKLLKLSVQPIVENSIKHGFSQKTDRGHLKINVFERDDHLIAEVIDDGLGISAADMDRICAKLDMEQIKTESIGIYNVHQRLKLNFGSECGLEIESVKGKYTKVTLKFPLIYGGEE